MRIWAFQTGEPLPLSPSATRMRTALLNEELVARGHQVVWWGSAFQHIGKVWIASPNSIIEVAEGYRVRALGGIGYKGHTSPRRYLDHRLVARNFRRQWPSEPTPDVMVIGMPDYHLAWEAVQVAKRLRVPAIVDVRDQWPDLIVDRSPRPLRPLARALLAYEFGILRSALKGADHLTSMMSEILDWALSYAGRDRRPTDRVFYLGNQGDRRDAPTQAPRWSDLVGKFVVTYVGTFGAYNNPAALVTAARQLQARAPDVATNVRFIVAGDGPRRQAIQAEASDLGQVTFPGWVEAGAMYDLLHASSVVVLPWDSDLPAFPNKTFAYLEAGVPVLNEAPGELARLLGQYGAGVNSRPMEPEWLVDRIVDYVRNPSALDSMARNARRLWEERLDRKRIFLEFADHVEAIAGGPKEGAARTARPTGLAS